MSEIAPSKPFGRWEWILAFRYLRNKRKNGGIGLIAAIAFSAIALAIAVLIIVMSVMNGFRSELLANILGFNAHIYVSEGEPGGITSDGVWQTYLTKLEAIPGVVSATPGTESQVVAIGQTLNGALVHGIRPQDLSRLTLVSNNIVAGSLNDFGQGEYGGDVIILGDRLAATLGVSAGDTLTLAGFGGESTPFGGQRTIQKVYTVGGIFSVGMFQYDSTYIFMPLEQAQLFFGRGGDVDSIEIRVANPDSVRKIDAQVRAVVGPTPKVADWQDANKGYFDALQVERFMIRLIMLLVVAMAALNIISALVMLVKNKERDIAILRTMGARQGSIMRIFMISGSTIGLAATPVGLLAGILVCANLTRIQHFVDKTLGVLTFNPEVYFLSSVPVKLDWLEVSIVAFWTFAISVLTTLYPSWRASKTDPVEALRYE